MQETTQSGTGPLDDVERAEKSNNGAAGAPRTPAPPIRYAGEQTPLKALRAALAPDERKVLAAAAQHIERHMIETWPEVLAGIRTSNREASFSATVQYKELKNDKLRAVVSARVRTPREDLEIDLHLTPDGQLALGLPEGLDDDEDSEA